jgi:REP element-mobilizing transposase RayT
MSKNCSYLLVVLFMVITVSTIGASVSAPENKAKVYRMYVDEVINKYEAKSCLSCSNSKSIQRDAALACMKAAYFKTFKQEIIRQMCEQNIAYKPHKVKLFLNQRFIDVIKLNSNRLIFVSWSALEVREISHHVTQRGSRRQQIFFSDGDFRFYLELMSEWREKFQVEIWAYCLMPNTFTLSYDERAKDPNLVRLQGADRERASINCSRVNWSEQQPNVHRCDGLPGNSRQWFSGFFPEASAASSGIDKAHKTIYIIRIYGVFSFFIKRPELGKFGSYTPIICF